MALWTANSQNPSRSEPVLQMHTRIWVDWKYGGINTVRRLRAYQTVDHPREPR